MAYARNDLKDTIVALATPPGPGAIALVRLSGPQAIDLVNAGWQGNNLLEQKSHTIHLGSIVSADGEPLDEVLASLFIGPHSYTGEDVVEVSCHGSMYIVQSLIERFTDLGARLAQPGEFTMRAFLHGRMDLSQAEAVADLIAAESRAQRDLALRQMRGGFSDRIKELRQRLLDFASLVELELDFGEEDVEFADRGKLRQLVEEILVLIRDLIQSFQMGNVIKKGVNTVIAGRPNAGKSTLLNALLREERAIVSEIAGTTRDTIEEVLHIDGVPFRLIDTAGIREAEDAIERIGVEKTLEKVQQSALLLYIFDVVATQPEEVQADLEKLVYEGLEYLVVANKMDLNPYTKWEQYAVGSSQLAVGGPTSPKATSDGSTTSPKATSDGMGKGKQGAWVNADNWVPVSAANEMNIEYLKERIHDAVVSGKLQTDNPVVTNVRHYEHLRGAEESLGKVLEGMGADVTADFVALDIRQALRHLGEITGEVTTDELLGNIFSNFCIGK